MKKKILSICLVLSSLFLIPSVLGAAWDSTMGCFQTGGFTDLECFLGNGFMSIFGTPIYMSLFGMLLGVLIAWKMRLPLDLSAVFIFALIIAFNYSFLPVWVFWMMVIIAATATGWGFYKFFKSRG